MRANSLTIAAIDANGISVSQSPAGAGDLTLTGVLTSTNPITGVSEWIADVPRVVGVVSDGNDSGNTFTVTGENQLGQAVTESITGPNVGTTNGTTLFRKITSIAIGAAAVGNITVGTTATVNTPWQPMNLHVSPFEVGVIIEANDTPTVTFTLQHTMDDIQDLTVTPTAVDDATIAAKTATIRGSVKEAVRAMRLEMTSFSAGTVQFGYVQAGIAN